VRSSALLGEGEREGQLGRRAIPLADMPRRNQCTTLKMQYARARQP